MGATSFGDLEFDGFAEALASIPDDSPMHDVILEQFLDYLRSTSPEGSAAAEVLLSSSSDPREREWGAHLKRLGRIPFVRRAAATELDLLILVPKRRELDACRDAFGLDAEPDLRVGEDCDVWTTTIGDTSVGLAGIGIEGNVEAAIEIGRISPELNFSAAVLVGMAAGLETEVNKGDVVVSSHVVAYEFVRATRTGFVSRARLYPADHRSVQKATLLDPDAGGWSSRAAAEIRTAPGFEGIDLGESEQLSDAWRPGYKVGVILAGSRLIEDGSLGELRKTVNERAVAAEMEGAGFAAACSVLRVPWLVIRGVADYGDQDVPSSSSLVDAEVYEEKQEASRGKSWQYPATYAAAVFVREVIIGGRLPLLPGARGGRKR